MNVTNQSSYPTAYSLTIDDEREGQRLDNFLITHLKGVPKSHIYRLVRKGEVRINKKRAQVSDRLISGDIVRIPPLQVATISESTVAKTRNSLLTAAILYEDEVLAVLNKPAGLAVHGGSGIDGGVIEHLRQLRPQHKFLELVHRLDKDTSGCLIIAKKRSALLPLHEQFRQNAVQKTYLALLTGVWQTKQQTVDKPLLKQSDKEGDQRVIISRAGKSAITDFRRLQRFQQLTLVEAKPHTGRTHQIRVHAANLGHPIVGDERYGIQSLNFQLRKRGYSRLFLHAKTLKFTHPLTAEILEIHAPLPNDLQQLLSNETKF
ncbi:MAG: rRNA pseudouridine synthase RluC [Pseudomonadota bacterium]